MIFTRLSLVFFLLTLGFVPIAEAQKSLELANDHLRIQWKNSPQGWQIQKVSVKKGNQWDTQLTPSGEYTLLYSETKPSTEAAQTFEKTTGGTFPEENYHYQAEQWKESTTAVSLNTAGKAYYFFPTAGKIVGKNHLQFTSETGVATLTTDWKLDAKYPTDVVVTQTLTPKIPGFFSLASPSVATVEVAKMGWTSVPGYFQGNYMQENFAKAYAYGFGVPKLPVVYRERTASTLAPLVSTKSGVTLAVIPEPGLARDPWAKDKITQVDWRLGLSHMNRKGYLSPTLYYPVLGEYASQRQPGESLTYSFRYSLVNGDWFKTIKHAIYDIYQFKEGLQLRQSTQSLTSRIEQMHHYLTDPKTSLWNIEEYKGRQIGAQSYLGGVVGSNKDAMKNSDYGAMWMLGKATQDPELTKKVLPYALNFKLTQQITDGDFFKGAIEGQYYLARKKQFVEEWGEVVEPIAVTYYIMLDIGNMLLFEPENAELKERLRLGAENLLSWQKSDGSWAVAYDKNTQEELFNDIADYRPTFYGLLVAYRILKDPKYLVAAKKGADWFVKNGVNRGSFLGVCGDARYAPDFATAQSAQALLDLYDLTKNETYKTAAIQAAKIYTSSVYTHPIPNHDPKTVNGTPREDWEIAQAGLNFEHGGIFGSASRHGPIQLASHAGLFIRMFEHTGETLFADMARAAAVGRDAFVDPKTSVASYYWQAMNKGAGPYPHHAWWQIGWLTDYLLSEAQLRSKGQVTFPRGFVTPKVGPHQTYGFAPGTINGEKANLVINEEWIQVNNPSIDYILAKATDSNKKYAILLNNRAQTTDFSITPKGKPAIKKQLPAWGIEIIVIE